MEGFGNFAAFALKSVGKAVAVGCVVAAAGLAGAQLTKQESAGIDRALALWNLAVSDLGFEKRLFHDPYRMPLVDDALSAPLDGLDKVLALQGVARSNSTKAAPNLDAAWRLIQPSNKADGGIVLNNSVGLKDVPAACRNQVDAAINIALEAGGYVNRALGKLSDQERADLLRTLPEIAAGSAVAPVRAGKGKLLSREDAFNLLGKVDLTLLEAASQKLATGLPPIVAKLQVVQGKVVIPRPIRFKALQLDVVVGSTGDDKFVGAENQLVIELRGNDSYGGRIGSGIGGCGVLIDLAGNDRFELSDYSGGFGLMGCGFVFDAGGNDQVLAKNFSLGSALVGAGLFQKDGGHDDYRSGACTQGFAMFGLGLMQDTRGDDRYSATDNAQGAALTEGVGRLIDAQGDDTYRVGGRLSGAPLDPKSWTCFGQGAASGFREDAGGKSGGIGILSDLNGDDVYQGGMYCQGASYWFALGALMDDAGNDTYTGDYYVQAIAMHFGAAYLVDLSGDDLYTGRTGTMHAIGHDYSVAMLLDREGDDVYSGKDSRPAKGIANGVGIFLDSAGNDRYVGPPSEGVAARGTGSIGLFVDLAGKDDYAHGLANGEVSLTGMWAIAVDFADPPSTDSGPIPAHVRPLPGTMPLQVPTEMERIYRKACQWGVGSAQKEVEENVDKLVAMGLPGLEWMLKNKLATADRLSMRAFDAVISAVGEQGKALLPPYVASKEGDAAANALTLCVTHKIAAVEPYLGDALVSPVLQRTAIRAAGAAKAQSLVPRLVGYAEGKDLSLALVALQALDQIGSEDAAYTFVKMATSPELPIRKTAIKALAKWPARAMEAAKVLLKREERPLRVGVELLGEIGADEAMALVAEQLKSADAGARLEAVRVLGTKDAANYRPLIEPLAADPDPDVKALVEWVLRRAATG